MMTSNPIHDYNMEIKHYVLGGNCELTSSLTACAKCFAVNTNDGFFLTFSLHFSVLEHLRLIDTYILN